MKILGIITGALGVLIMLSSFGMDTAPEGTHNVGLLQEQMMMFSLGSVLILAGTIVAAIAHALTRLNGRDPEGLSE